VLGGGGSPASGKIPKKGKKFEKSGALPGQLMLREGEKRRRKQGLRICRMDSRDRKSIKYPTRKKSPKSPRRKLREKNRKAFFFKYDKKSMGRVPSSSI